MTLHNVIIDIKSVLNKDKNHCYYKIYLEKCFYQLAQKQSLKFISYYNNADIQRDKKQPRKGLIQQKKIMRIWDANVDNAVISKLVKTKTNSKYLIRYSDKVIRPSVLIMHKMSGYVKR